MRIYCLLTIFFIAFYHGVSFAGEGGASSKRITILGDDAVPPEVVHKISLPEKASLPDSPTLPERPEMAERPDRPDRPERPERVERPARPDRPEMPEKPIRPGQ